MLRLYLYARVRISLSAFAHGTAGAAKHPAFPAPSHFWGETIPYNSGKSCCENANMCLHVIASQRVAHARPMTDSAKQSIVTPRAARWIASLRSQ